MTSKKLHSFEQNHNNQPRHELLQVADVVAREKGIERDEVIVAMELAMQKAAKAKYGAESDIRAEIDRTTGEVSLHRVLKVVDKVEEPDHEIWIDDVLEDYPEIELGEEVCEPLPPIEFGRVSAQSARQVIFQKVREAERAKQFEEFKDRVGHIVSALVKRVEFGNVVMDMGRAEGMLRRDNVIPRETLRVGDRVRVYIEEIKPENRGPMISLSRTHPQFMARLFEQEVPEIYDNVIEVKAVARDPGSRAKIAVFSADPSIDPVGACVGMRGSRVQAVINELQGEKVDIVLWSQSPANFVVNALAPAEVVKVVLDEEKHRVDVIVMEDQLSLAIGRRGQNVRLATQLTGWNIDILTEEQETNRRVEEYAIRTKLFIEALDVDEMIAQLLAAEGFTSIEDLSVAPLSDLTCIEGFDEEIAAELQNRAITYIADCARRDLDRAKELGLGDDLAAIESLTEKMLLKLAENGVKTLDDFADLAGDELVELLGKDQMLLDEANALIMIARAHWFTEEEKPAE